MFVDQAKLDQIIGRLEPAKEKEAGGARGEVKGGEGVTERLAKIEHKLDIIIGESDTIDTIECLARACMYTVKDIIMTCIIILLNQCSRYNYVLGSATCFITAQFITYHSK